jgi:hypothetical protein
MKKLSFLFALLLVVSLAKAQSVQSPDGKISVVLELLDGGRPHYRVLYEGQEVVRQSALGIRTNIGDFTQGLVL